MISIEHSIHKRSIPELSLYVKRSGLDRKFILQSSEGFFAGKKTKVWVAKKNGKKFSYFLRNDVSEIYFFIATIQFQSKKNNLNT